MSYIAEAIREWAFQYGRENPEQAWLLSAYDTWEVNPFYRGPKVPHPEAECYEDEPVVDIPENELYISGMRDELIDDIPF